MLLPPINCITNPSRCSYGLIPNTTCIHDLAVGYDYCVCPPGWKSDNIFAHLNNCLIPDKFEFAIGIVVTLCNLIPFVLHASLRSVLHDNARKVSESAMIGLVMVTATAISILLQEGMYEGAAIFYAGIQCSIFLGTKPLFDMFIAPLVEMARFASTDQTPIVTEVCMGQVRRVLVAANALGFLPIVFAAIAYCRDANPIIYNEMIALVALSTSVLYSVAFLMCFQLCRRLQFAISEARNSAHQNPSVDLRLKQALFRIWLIKLVQVTLFVLVTIPFFVIFCVLQSLGTFPGLGYVFSGAMLSASPIGLLSFWALRKFSRTPKSTSKPLGIAAERSVSTNVQVAAST